MTCRRLLLVGLAVAVLPVAAQQPTFRSGVTLVTTDVIARGERGQFVSDLSR